MKTKASLKQLILAVSVSLLAFPLISTVAFAKSQGDKRGGNKASETGCKQQVGDNTSGKVNQACRDIYITNKIYKSIEYKEIQQEINSLEQGLKTAQNRAKKYPDDVSFQNDLIDIGKKLAGKRKQLIQFKKEITKLYNDLQKIPNDNKRLKKAKALFNEGKFREARVFLEDEESSMRGEQEALLKQKDTTQKQLQNNAEEYITLAKLTAIDYSLKDQRISKTRAYFKQALKSDRSPKNLYEYAFFLQKNNLFKASEEHYREALTILANDNADVYLPGVVGMLNNLALLIAADRNRRGEVETLYKEVILKTLRQSAKDNAGVYLPNVATVLNNLANFVAKDSNRGDEAETLYREALTIRRQLSEDNAGVYLPHVATTLNNLALLIAVDRNRGDEAETLYQEALTIRRQLSKDNAGVYLPYVATTLNNLALLIAVDRNRGDEAETIYQESLTINRQLSKDNAGVYLPKVAGTLNNLARLISADRDRRGEAETFYLEALTIQRQLAKDNVDVYFPDVAITSGLLGLAYFRWSENSKALPLLREATNILRPLANNSPGVFAKKQGAFLTLLAMVSDQENEQCKVSREALSLAQNRELIKVLQDIKKKSCQ